jgi:hypothetical protein
MSANSEDAIRESYVLIIKLLERTRERKIKWTSGDPIFRVERGAPGPEAVYRYQTKLANDLTATVWEDDHSLGFELTDPQAGLPEPSIVMPPSGAPKGEVHFIRLDKMEAGLGKLTDESIVYEDLAALLAMIRHAPAYQSDSRIEQAKNYLDELAS